ncbi:hypothetical protein EV361DRAFT_235210 [Lentinula raphanica]|nr:hypothetical protein EV361DRAFT_235210 [Lentinula raphanica]
MPRVTRAQHLAESEAARRMYALNQTREAGQAGGSNADFQSNQGQARRPRSEVDPGEAARRPSPFLDPDPNIGRNSMDFNPPPSERGRESGGVPEEEVPPSSDEDDSDYSPGHTQHSQSSISNHSQYESDFDDRDDFSCVEEVDYEETGRGRRRGNRMASDQRRFLESDDSSDEDYAPSRSLAGRTESLGPVGSRGSRFTRRTGSDASRHSSLSSRHSSLRPASRQTSHHHISRQSSQRPASRQSSRRPVSRQSSRRPVSRQSSRRPVSRHSSRRPASHHSSRRPVSPYSSYHTSHHSVSRHSSRHPASRYSVSPIPVYHHRLPPDLPRNPDVPRRAQSHRERGWDRGRVSSDDEQHGQRHRHRRHHVEVGRNRDDIPGYQSPMDDDQEAEAHRHRGLKRRASIGDESPRWQENRRRHSRSPSPTPRRGHRHNNQSPTPRRRSSRSLSPVPQWVQRNSRRRRSRSYSPASRRRRDPEQLPPLENFRRPRHELVEDRYNRRGEQDVGGREREVVKSSKSRVPFPKVTESIMPRSDPVGMLTSVSQAVITVLRNGWCEPIPLGHFARRNNLLFTSYTALDASSFHITEGGQVRLKTKRLHDISIMDLTINDWNEIKRNMPKAIREHLIPDDEVFPGSTEALAAAEMIENLFRIVDDQARIGEEYIPLMFYVDTKIQFWRARPERKERIDFFDFIFYRDVYEAWKALVESREAEKREAEKKALFKNPKGNFSFQSYNSKPSFRNNGQFGGSSNNKANNKFTKHRCIFCGGDHHSKNHIASASDYLKQDEEGVYRNSSGKRICFSYNGLKGCSFPSPCKHGEHR